jgi:hypothetical protein
LEITLWYKIIITVIPYRRGTGWALVQKPGLILASGGTFDKKLV